nr:YdcH family protein [Gammaproteobacteria bacterium]
MFEYDQSIVQVLLTKNEQFRDLYKEHHELKEKVRNAELGILPVDDFTLGTMKKQKLLAKDKMAHMIEKYRQEHESQPGSQAKL